MAQVQQLTPAQQAALQNQKAVAANLQARNFVLQQAFPIVQAIDSRTFDPANVSTVEINPRNIGIVTGFTIRVKAKIKNGSTAAINRTTLGAANLLQRVAYYDPNNQLHTDTTGWHLHLVNTAKQGDAFMKASAPDATYPVAYGDVLHSMYAPQQIAASAEAEIEMLYYVPLAYSETDLSGAVFANVPQSTQRLRMAFAPSNQAIVAAGQNSVESVYSGAADAVVSSYEVTVYQHYLDQLPQINGNYILPSMDLSTIYKLETSAQSGITPNVDFVVQYANLYRYLSTVAIFDNGGTLSATDLTDLSVKTASFSDIRKMTPDIWTMAARRRIGSDFPEGVWYYDSRQKPIVTQQYGNMSFNVNANKVNQNARLLMGYEYLNSATELVSGGTIATS